jgi:hypothetical protein
MRGLFGLVGLVVVLAIVGLLAKKQLSATRAPVPALQTAPRADPASAPPDAASPAHARRRKISQIGPWRLYIKR